jgi:3D (Asp-Asp-Asp) domain-containing protein
MIFRMPIRRWWTFLLPLLALISLPALAVAAPAGTTRAHAAAVAKRAQSRLLTKATWVNGVELTQYWPVPEAWFPGQLVAAPGLAGLHPIDWLYSARGLSMQGEGISLAGQFVHINQLGAGGWVTASGQAANFHGTAPYWRAGGYWKSSKGAVTFPLRAGGWSNGTGKRYVSLPGVSFAAGPAKALTYWESVAVDPSLIPMGSWIYIPSYRTGPGKGWFMAQDTGGAIGGAHLDIFRPPPASPSDPGQTLWGQQVYVLPPGQALANKASLPASPPAVQLAAPIVPQVSAVSRSPATGAPPSYEIAGGTYPALLSRGASGGAAAPPG